MPPKPVRAKKLTASSLKTALRLVWQAAPGLTIVGIVLALVQSVPFTLTLYLNKLVLDAVVTGLRSHDRTAALHHALQLIALTGGTVLLGNLLSEAASLAQEAQSLAITNHIAAVVHAKAVEVDLEAYENPRYYDTLSRVQREASYRPSQVLNGLMQLAQNGINLLAVAGLLFALHWGIALLLFAVTIPGAIVQMRFSGRTYRWMRSRTPTERQVSYFNWMLSNDQTAKEIRLFNLGQLFIRRFVELREQLRRERLALTLKSSVADLITRFAATLAVYGSYGYMVLRALQHAITLGSLNMYYQAFQRGQGLLQGLFGNLVSLYEHNLYLSDLEEFLKLERRVAEPATPQPLPHPMREGVVFDHVRFRYPMGGDPVLEDVSLTIRPGEMVALVGENGSGKSTLIKLLCRLYDPTEGSITIDGTDLREFDTLELRREISVIFQDYVKYQLTARENIQFGNPDMVPDEERLVAAAQHSGADAVVASLKQGYDTVLGKWFEGGEELSIGQWQKIALARAFLRESQLIVLDEPTSAMDAKAEYDLFRSFRELAAGRAAVLISHRFSTVRMADCIYVLDGGKIIERGTHDTLMALNGTYAHLFEMQAQHYR
jgi:ATP-binding cassette, subfamily B, bacterial